MHYVMTSKPHGLWVSVEDFEEDENWKTWCETEKFRVECLKYRYLVTINPKAKIIYLKTTEEITEFGKTYAWDGLLSDEYIYALNWDHLMSEYDGIIIAPYQWDCRFGSLTSWYYGWDCASGCIWNIKHVKLTLDSIREETEARQEEENEKDSRTISEGR